MSCQCGLSGEESKLVLRAHSCGLHKQAGEGDWALRVWVVVPGYLANSYRRDTSADLTRALKFVASKYYNGVFECSLEEYLAEEKDETVPLGFTLHYKGTALVTPVVTYNWVRGARTCTEEAEMERRLLAATQELLQHKQLDVPPQAIAQGLRDPWLQHFVGPVKSLQEASPRFVEAAMTELCNWVRATVKEQSASGERAAQQVLEMEEKVQATEEALHAAEEAKKGAEEGMKAAEDAVASAQREADDLRMEVARLQQRLAAAQLEIAKKSQPQPLAQPQPQAQPQAQPQLAKPSAAAKQPVPAPAAAAPKFVALPAAGLNPAVGLKPAAAPAAAVTSPAPKAGEWACPACTFLNKATDVSCEVCGYSPKK